MVIILSYDSHWEYANAEQKASARGVSWESLDTVDFVAEMLRDTGSTVLPVKTDDAFEFRLTNILKKHPGALLFWLNEFMPTNPGRNLTVARPFTVSLAEKMGMMHTGPGSQALGIGLDKGATKDVLRRLGLPTPESYVVNPGDYSPIDQHSGWEGYVIIKPLLHGDSISIEADSVVDADDVGSIQDRVAAIHQAFDEPALVERYIEGEGTREFTISMLIAHDERTAALPITEIDLSRLPAAQGKFKFLTHAIKEKKNDYLKIPAQLPPEVTRRMIADAGRIIREMGCRDMVRIDLRVDAAGWHYLEVNVNPGKTRFSSYLTASAYSSGLDYPAIIAFIPYQAMLRYGLEPPRELEELVKPILALFDPDGTIAGSP